MGSTTVRSFLKDNNQPLYGLERTQEVNLYVLFYQNLIITSLFDLKKAKVNSARRDALAFMYWGVSRFLLYLGYSFSPGSIHNTKVFNYFSNIYEIEYRFASMCENTNKWLIGSTDFDTITVGDALTEALGYMNNLLVLCETTLGEVLYRALEIFGKQWKLPEQGIDSEIRRLDTIRKKFLSMERLEDQINDKNLLRILPSLKQPTKKLFTIGTRQARNIRVMQRSGNTRERKGRNHERIVGQKEKDSESG